MKGMTMVPRPYILLQGLGNWNVLSGWLLEVESPLTLYLGMELLLHTMQQPWAMWVVCNTCSRAPSAQCMIPPLRELLSCTWRVGLDVWT